MGRTRQAGFPLTPALCHSPPSSRLGDKGRGSVKEPYASFLAIYSPRMSFTVKAGIIIPRRWGVQTRKPEPGKRKETANVQQPTSNVQLSERTRLRPSGYAGASGSRRDPRSTSLRASLRSLRSVGMTRGESAMEGRMTGGSRRRLERHVGGGGRRNVNGTKRAQ